MSALTDRYVSAVLRALPSGQRADLEPEIRALVGDAIEARNDDPPLDGEAAERAALTELGDPTALAAGYAGTPQYLIGPRFFGEWRRLLTMLLPIIVPIIGAVVLVTNLFGGSSIGSAIAAVITTVFNVTIQTLFWFTLVFAALERFSDSSALDSDGWSVDDLPELPETGRISAADAISSIIANVVVAAAILWVMLWPPFVIDGTAYPLFDPALWSFWLPYLLIVTGLEVVFGTLLYARGHWTFGLATANAMLGAAFAIPALWLLANDMLFNPALISALHETTPGEWATITGTIVGITVAVIVVWDSIDGFRKARAWGNTTGTSNVRGA